MASLVLTLKGSGVDALKAASSAPHEAIRDLINHLSALSSGNEKGTIYAQSSTVDPVAASATATLTSCATDTITIGSITFTGTASPSTSLHFETDGDDTADAAALAAAINAHTTTNKIVIATSSTNVVTIQALQRGLVGNFIPLTETGSTIVCTGSGFLAGGTGGAANSASTYAFGQ